MQAPACEDFFCLMLPDSSRGSLRGLIFCHDTVRYSPMLPSNCHFLRNISSTANRRSQLLRRVRQRAGWSLVSGALQGASHHATSCSTPVSSSSCARRIHACLQAIPTVPHVTVPHPNAAVQAVRLRVLMNFAVWLRRPSRVSPSTAARVRSMGRALGALRRYVFSYTGRVMWRSLTCSN
jgi:hypothetical protein